MVGIEWTNIAWQVGAGVVLVLGFTLFAAIAIGLIYLNKLAKTYAKNKVIVWKRYRNPNGEEMPVMVDMKEQGRVRYNKKLKKWEFHLKNADVVMGEEETKTKDEDRDLDIPSIPYEKGGRVIFIEKLGNRKYAFGKPFIIEGNVKVIVSEADCAEAIKSYDTNAKTFGKKPNYVFAFTLYIIFAVLVLVMIIMILQKFESITTAAEAFKQGAVAAAQAKGAAVASAAPA